MAVSEPGGDPAASTEQEDMRKSVTAESLTSDNSLEFRLEDLTLEEKMVLESDLGLAARMQRARLPHKAFDISICKSQFRYGIDRLKYIAGRNYAAGMHLLLMNIWRTCVSSAGEQSEPMMSLRCRSCAAHDDHADGPR
jgi:hypothetical protein